MEILAVFQNGKAYLWYHPESDCYYIDNEDATDGLAHQCALVEKIGNVMRVHFPELYDAHKLRDVEFLTGMANRLGLTYEQFESSNWDSKGNLDMAETRNDIPPPADVAKTPTRRGRPRGATNKSTQAAQLQEALYFVECAVSDTMPYGDFVSLVGNMAIVHSGRMSAGHPIVEELKLVPHLGKLKAALNKCGKTLVITETEHMQLSIKGDKLRALVPCHVEPIPENPADPVVLNGDYSALKEAFKVCGTLASENGERLIEASLLLGPNVCTGTNGSAMLQYWHGVNVPHGTVVSKAFAAAIAKQSKLITGLGATWDSQLGFARSLTVWFEGGAWIKTQCYNDRWPDTIDGLLATDAEKIDTPVGLFEAIEAILPFCDGKEHKRIHFKQDFVQTHNDANVGAKYAVTGLPGGKCFDGKLMSQVAPWVKRIDLVSSDTRAFFVGGEASNPVRGVIMSMSE